MARTDSLLLLTGDYAGRLDALYDAVMQAKEDAEGGGGGRRLNEDPVSELSEEYVALKAEAEAAGIRVVLRDLTRPEWRKLKEQHPPRVAGDEENQKTDRFAGFDVESGEDDLVYGSLLSVTEGGKTVVYHDETGKALLSRAAFDEWFNGLSNADCVTISTRAWTHNNVARTDPKSLPASPTRSNGAS